MKKTLMACAIGVAIAQSGLVQAEGNWMWRIRAIHIAPDASSAPVAGVDASNETVPEVDFTYFINKNIAMELVLTIARPQVTLNGANLGKVSLLPPTLLLQYHFTQSEKFKPYVGAGINYTRFYGVSLNSPLDIERTSWGGALQVGVDVAIDKSSYINFDLKKIYIETDVKNNGAFLTTFKINPVVFGIGYGRRF